MNPQIKHYENKLTFEMDPADLFAAMNNGGKFIPVDARLPEGFMKEHIPGAINFPHRNMTQESTSTLDREATYVVYCDGIGCNASTRGALKLASLGFKVKELVGGIEWWKFDGYDTDGAQGVELGARVKCYC